MTKDACPDVKISESGLHIEMSSAHFWNEPEKFVALIMRYFDKDKFAWVAIVINERQVAWVMSHFILNLQCGSIMFLKLTILC